MKPTIKRTSVLLILPFCGAWVLIASACAEGNTLEDPLQNNSGSSGGSDGGKDGSASLPGIDSGTLPEPESDSGTGPADSGSNIPAACATALNKNKFDFEGSDQGWVHTDSDNAAAANPSWPFDFWTRGNSQTLACADGQCFAAERDKNYVQCGRGELISPKLDLTACKTASLKVTLVFEHAYQFWTDNTTWFDGGILEISSDDAATWSVPPSATYSGTVKIRTAGTGSIPASYKCIDNPFHATNKPGYVKTQATTTAEIEVPAAALTDKMRIRFSQASGVSSANSNAESSRPFTAAGWRIDNVHFTVK